MLQIVPMEPIHAAEIERQLAQATTLGLAIEMSEAYGQEIVDAPGESWAAIERKGGVERVVALFGLVETFRHVQATAWAVLSAGLGAYHLPITRFCAERIRESEYRRIEAIVECADAEPLLARMPGLDPGQLVAAMQVPGIATVGVRWAEAVGMTGSAVLRRYGAASETHMLFERIR